MRQRVKREKQRGNSETERGNRVEREREIE
jgi:hypothetical protein